MAPLIEPLVAMGSNNRYVEIAIILPFTGAVGPGTNMLGFNNKAGVVSDVTYLQSKGIRVELSPFQHLELINVKERVLDPGIARPPVILDTLVGRRNTPAGLHGIEAFEYLFALSLRDSFHVDCAGRRGDRDRDRCLPDIPECWPPMANKSTGVCAST